MIIMVPTQPGQISEGTMHENVQNGLKALKEDQQFDAESGKSLWVPQFRIGKMGDSKPYSVHSEVINF